MFLRAAAQKFDSEDNPSLHHIHSKGMERAARSVFTQKHPNTATGCSLTVSGQELRCQRSSSLAATLSWPHARRPEDTHYRGIPLLPPACSLFSLSPRHSFPREFRAPRVSLAPPGAAAACAAPGAPGRGGAPLDGEGHPRARGHSRRRGDPAAPEPSQWPALS